MLKKWYFNWNYEGFVTVLHHSVAEANNQDCADFITWNGNGLIGIIGKAYFGNYHTLVLIDL
jgi:hypothetical protein